MAEFKPHTPYNVPAFLLTPATKNVKGTLKKVWPEPTQDDLFFCSFRTFGGTETNVNGVISVENTATVETYFDPKFKADRGVLVDGAIYEIIGTPENIGMRNQYVVFKVKGIGGGA